MDRADVGRVREFDGEGAAFGVEMKFDVPRQADVVKRPER